jgi:hypothetical protein
MCVCVCVCVCVVFDSDQKVRMYRYLIPSFVVQDIGTIHLDVLFTIISMLHQSPQHYARYVGCLGFESS